MDYYVLYRVDDEPRRSGPYDTWDEASLHKRDIESYVGVTNAEITKR